jgi:hypothetical protein
MGEGEKGRWERWSEGERERIGEGENGREKKPSNFQCAIN